MNSQTLAGEPSPQQSMPLQQTFHLQSLSYNSALNNQRQINTLLVTQCLWETNGAQYGSCGTHYSTGPQQPLYIHCSGKSLTLQDFCHNLRILIKHIELSPEEYSTHSLRIGAATTAAVTGIPVKSIKQLG